MKTCATCKFFNVNGELDGVTAWSDEADDTIESAHRKCLRIVHGNDGRKHKDVSSELAIVTDGSGYAACLRVLPTFGCILHEEQTP